MNPNCLRRLFAAVVALAVCLAWPAADAAAKKRSASKRQPVAAAADRKPQAYSFSKPDFAFPRDVSSNAAARLDRAVASANWLDALQAAVQISVATNLVSKDSVAYPLSVFSSLAEKAPAPYSQLASLLEARLYRDIYNSQSWIFNQRTLPSDSVPADPMLWDREMFRTRIAALAGNAYAMPAQFKCMPVSSFYPLIKEELDLRNRYITAENEGYLLFDFISDQVSDLLLDGSDKKTIPFGDSQSAHAIQPSSALTPEHIADALYVFHKAENPESLAMGQAVVRRANLLDDSRRSGLLASQLGELPFSEDLVPIAEAYYQAAYPELYGDVSYPEQLTKYDPEVSKSSRPISPQELLDILERLKTKLGDSPAAPTVDNMISRLKAESLAFSMRSTAYPMKPITVQIARRNCQSASLLVFQLPDYMDPDNIDKLSSVLPKLKLRLSTTLPLPAVAAESLMVDTCTVNIPGLNAGRYIVTASADNSVDGIFKGLLDRNPASVNVSAIDLVCIDAPGHKSYLYVVDAMTQAPVKGASLKFVENPGSKHERTASAVSDAEGCAVVPYRACRVTANYRGSRISDYSSNYRTKDQRIKSVHASVFTDLAIYHPGDSVAFSTVVLSNDDNRLSVVAGRMIKALLKDANYQTVDSLALTTDRFGRAFGKMTTPKSGMLGAWTVEILDGHAVSSRKSNYLGSRSIQVADYKTPTFFIAVDSVPAPSADLVTISGRVMTYSGMPLGDSKVAYNISYSPVWPWWRGSYAGEDYGSTTTTDAGGRFLIKLPIARLRGTKYEDCRFTMTLTATSPSGETQQPSPVDFSISNPYYITGDVPMSLEVSGDFVSFSLKVVDLLDRPQRREVEYSVVDTSGKKVASGSFTSPTLSIPASKLPSGSYTLKAWLPDQKSAFKADTLSRTFAAWRLTDRKPPVATSLWIPRTRIVAKPGQKKVKVRVGESYPDNWILMAFSDNSGLIEHKWIRPKGGIVEVELPVPADNDRVFANFSGLYDFTSLQKAVMVCPASADSQLTVETSSFRNKLNPLAKEKWTFRFLKDGNPAGVIPAMAVLSNKALDNIVPFNWYFQPGSSLYYGSPLGISSVGYYSVGSRLPLNIKWNSTPTFIDPEFNFYNFSLYGGYPTRSHWRIRGASNGVMFAESQVMMDAAAPAPEAKMNTAAVKELAYATDDSAPSLSEEAVEEEATGASNVSKPSLVLRPAELPLAFFRPDLVTDAEGNVSIDFEVPDYNTTWKLQILGYTQGPDILSAMTTLDAVASKKVMVSSNIPAFVRTGDRVLLSALMFNNTDAALPVAGSINVYDAVSGTLLLEKDFNSREILPSGNSLISESLLVPANTTALRIVCTASADHSSDGEQLTIPVLPAASPVIDSKPFYLAPGEGEFSLTLPDFKKNDNVTFRYCDNPVWYCLTALPDITVPDSESAWSLSNALYGNAIASGLIAKYPSLKEGLRLALSYKDADDSILRSNLEKDAELKTVALNNTPWVNNASSETLRMMRLGSLLDKRGAEAAIAEIWKRLERLRGDDGGWSWCPGMPSSMYITTKVLTNLGMLRSMGYLPEVNNIQSAIVSAVAYCDNEILESYRRNPKTFNPESLLPYLYTRSFFQLPDAGKEFYSIRSKAIAGIIRNWRSYSIYDKATAAILLQREGHKAEAANILASLNQFSSYKAEKGRWFDNLRSSWNSYPTLITTAQVLEAIAEINPQSKDIDQIRQWLILQRETQDWGAVSNTAEVVDAILSSGSDWTATPASGLSAKITLDGRPLEFSSRQALTGTVTLQLDPTEASGKRLSVSKNSAGPAWGGVISQYVAPIKDVRPAKVADLSISKDFYLVSETGQGRQATAVSEFKKGDRVRVTLTVICGRDMDYVALTDQRAACFRPVMQTAEYTSSDGLFYYLEPRTSATNLFFQFLPRGKHIITYDLFVTQEGTFSSGIATVQSQYAPMQTAHTAGNVITVK